MLDRKTIEWIRNAGQIRAHRSLKWQEAQRMKSYVIEDLNWNNTGNPELGPDAERRTSTIGTFHVVRTRTATNPVNNTILF